MQESIATLEIDLSAVKHNYKLAEQCAPNCVICPVVKANAYGHGDIEIAKALVEQGARWLAVATIDEAIKLRDSGLLQARILLLGGDCTNYVDELVRYKITPSLISVQSVSRLAEKLTSPMKVHIEIDTGMSRLGVKFDQLSSLISVLKVSRGIELEGLFTHFANADQKEDVVTDIQLCRFNAAIDHFDNEGMSPSIKHVANSAAVLSRVDDSGCFDMVRPGLMIYGVSPFPDGENYGLKVCSRWLVRPLLIKNLNKGESVSYAGLWKAPQDSCIAILSVGYADGYPRCMTGKAKVLVQGKYAPVVGNICMDYSIVDITGIANVNYDTEIVLLGKQGGHEISHKHLAEWSATIPYEVMCRIGGRVIKKYV